MSSVKAAETPSTRCCRRCTIFYSPDFVIVNGENAAAGLGITPDIARHLLESGVDVITLGNHTWSKRDIGGISRPRAALDTSRPIIRPGRPDKGHGIFCCRGGLGRVGVANLMGTDLHGPAGRPVPAGRYDLGGLPGTNFGLVLRFPCRSDFREKRLRQCYLDGRASVVVGTHTHVQTADERLLPRGTAYITDVGMVGPQDSILGMNAHESIQRFITQVPHRFEVARRSGCLCAASSLRWTPKPGGRFPVSSASKFATFNSNDSFTEAILISEANTHDKNSSHPSADPGADRCVAVSAAPANADRATSEMAAASPMAIAMLYDGKAVSPSLPSAVADWGGGSGQESTETYILGGHSLRVTTLDPYQGARITFAAPVSLAGDNRVLQLILRRGGVKLHYDPQTVGLPGGGNPNGFNPGQFPGFPSRNGQRRRRPTGPVVSATPLIPEVTALRLHLIFADGRQADVVRPISETADAAAGEGWYGVNVPISTLNLGGGTAPLLKSVTLGGNHYGVFFVGRIQLATDTPDMAFTIDGPDHVPSGQFIKLVAKGDAGLSTVRYAWDIGTDSSADSSASDVATPAGFPAASPLIAGSLTGSAIVLRYPAGGQDHTITLTVTDTDGLKKPVTVTKTIHVNRAGNGLGAGNGFGAGAR